ncbi:MAG: class I lanthipeptide [Candidatus Aminicenantes bacterium]|jgi:hypothetical protein
MKRKLLRKKLVLNKTTISNLNNGQLRDFVGGATPACTDPACSIEACPVVTQVGKTCDTCPGYTCITVEETSCFGTICA